MADGRKNNGGHSTKGKAGRKPKIDELKLIEKLDNVIESDDVLKKLKDLIQDNNYNAIKLYFEYRFGKPVDKIDVNTNVEDNEPPEIVFVKRDDKD
tara:strand:- start:1164 stop:1451 length:288 start_codon:yes stop_codon:yes gene_type:complete